MAVWLKRYLRVYGCVWVCMCVRLYVCMRLCVCVPRRECKSVLAKLSTFLLDLLLCTFFRTFLPLQLAGHKRDAVGVGGSVSSRVSGSRVTINC